MASLSVTFIFSALICAEHFRWLFSVLLANGWLSLSPLVQFEDSEEDFDSRFDTDDELSYRRDSVYSCVTLPYFHSFLYMKGMPCSCPGAWVRGRSDGKLRLMEGRPRKPPHIPLPWC